MNRPWPMSRHQTFRRIVVEIEWRVPLQQLTVVHDTHHVAHAEGFVLVVGDHDCGDSLLLQYEFDLLSEALSQISVQTGERFVQKNQIRFGGERPGQCDTLLLSARQFVGKRPAIGCRSTMWSSSSAVSLALCAGLLLQSER